MVVDAEHALSSLVRVRRRDARDMAAATEKYNWCVENSIVAGTVSVSVSVSYLWREIVRCVARWRDPFGFDNQRRAATGDPNAMRCDGCDDAMTDD